LRWYFYLPSVRARPGRKEWKGRLAELDETFPMVAGGHEHIARNFPLAIPQTPHRLPMHHPPRLLQIGRRQWRENVRQPMAKSAAKPINPSSSFLLVLVS
jgi:hypothetical protein